MNLKSLFTVVLGLMLGLFLIVQVLTGGWNSISNFYKYLMIGVISLSFFNPKFGFYFLIFSSGYMDLFKRFLVVGGQFNFTDLIYIVGLPSLCSFSVFAGCSINYFLNPIKDRGDRFRFWLSIGLAGMVVVGGVVTGAGGLGGLKEVAFAAGFVPLIFVAPFLIKKESEVRRVVLLLIICFIPVCAYTYWQAYYGLSSFEIAYLETGLSSESRMLKGQDFRFFSTLNSSQNLAKIMALFGSMCLLPLAKFQKGNSRFKIVSFMILGGFFYYAAYLSGARTGLVMGVFLILAFWIVRNKYLTVFSYILAITSLVFIIFTSEYVLKNGVLGDMEGFCYRVSGIDRNESRIFYLGTLSIRFESLAGIANGDHLFPFGAAAAGKPDFMETARVHETLSSFMIKFGYVPMLVVLLVMAPVMWKLHSFTWKLKKTPKLQNLAAFGIANFVSVFIGSLSAGSNFSTFPVTYFLYLFAGFAVAAVYQGSKQTYEKSSEPDEDVSVFNSAKAVEVERLQSAPQLRSVRE